MLRILDPRKRANMAEFVTVSLICLALATPLLVIVERAPEVQRVGASLVGLWLIMAVMWIAAIRRLHDNDDGAVWVFWTMGGPTLLLLGATLWSTGVALPSWFLRVGWFVASTLTVAGHYSFLQAAGTAGPNRFGPDTQRYRPRSPSRDIGEGADARPLYDPRGRTSRSGFIVRLALCAVLAAPLIVMTRSAVAMPVWALAMGVVAFTLAAVLLVVSSVRRTHDLDNAREVSGGSFGLLVGLGPLFCAPAIWFPGVALAPALAVGAILSCGLLFIASMGGHHGPNRHGPDSVRNRPAPKVRTAHTEDFLKIRRKMKRLALQALSFTDADEAGFSKLGGDPEMPAQLSWPLADRGPLSFLAQIDLAQARIAGGSDWLPQTGGLYLFVEAHGGGGDGHAAVVLHAPDISAARAASPRRVCPSLALASASDASGSRASRPIQPWMAWGSTCARSTSTTTKWTNSPTSRRRWRRMSACTGWAAIRAKSRKAG